MCRLSFPARLQVRITDPDQYQSIVDAEWKVIYGKLDKIVATGANIVLSRLAIGDLATQCVKRKKKVKLDAARLQGRSSATVLAVSERILFSGTLRTGRSSVRGVSRSPISCACVRPPAARCRPQ